MTYASVEDWLNEIIGYSLRAEHMTADEISWATVAWKEATERCEDIVRQWTDLDFARLHIAGKLTQQEEQIIKAVTTAILTQIQSK